MLRSGTASSPGGRERTIQTVAHLFMPLGDYCQQKSLYLGTCLLGLPQAPHSLKAKTACSRGLSQTLQVLGAGLALALHL